MCGLVGLAGDTSGTWKDLFSELLLFDSMRGTHSTGAGFVGRANSEFKLAKRPGHPFNLFETKDFEDGMTVSNPTKVLLGHNRFATIGKHTVENAHPFAFENVIGMHNGTLDTWSIDAFPNNKDYGTDSETIMASINNTSLQESLKVMTGAWALVWYDKRDDTLNMCRNDKRPLHYCYSEDRCTIIWASEADMLTYLMGRRRKKILGESPKNTGIFMIAKDVHYKWKVPTSVNKKFDTPLQTKAEGKSYTHYTAPFKHGPGKTSTTHSSSVTYKHSASNIVPFALKPNTKAFRPPYKDQYGHVINKEQFLEMVQEGCAFCSDNNLKWGNFVSIMGRWIGPKSTAFMCESCYDNADTYDIAQYAL